MKLNAMYKYQLLDHRNAVFIFCAVVLAVMAFVPIQLTVSSDFLASTAESTQIAGIDLAPAVFLFVCGLSAFKENFLFALQNGISRKSLFINRIYVAITLAVIFALFSLLLLALGKSIESSSSSVDYTSTVNMIYQSAGTFQSNGLIEYLNSFLFLTVLFVAAQALGYLITVIFYRMNKRQKITYVVGFYVVIFVLLPIIDMLVSGQLSAIILKFLDMTMGISAHNPFIGMFSLVIFSLILSGITWMLIRKAGVKN